MCPPETIKVMRGKRIFPHSSAAKTCPSRWLTATTGQPKDSAAARAASLPTSRGPMSPGPRAKATASTRRPSSAVSMTSEMRCRCARAASSGTTPWKRRCSWIWEETTLERMRPSSTTPAEVSSQVVSMPRTFIGP